MSNTIYILGIESSCDDTSASIICNDKILTNYIANQQIHSDYGGVVPELASREHQKNIIPVVDRAIKNAGISKEDLHAVAYTKGPGLLGSLLVGSSFSKGFSAGLGIPLLEINHMEAHILAHFIDHEDHKGKPSFPFLNLTVSGGHTQLVLVKDFNKMELIGQTRDDAAGEAFDKCGKLLGLEYPAGPQIDHLAKNGDPGRFKFPKSDTGKFEFSFSGLKTAFLYFLRDELEKDAHFIKHNLADICASLQNNIVEVLTEKLEAAGRELGIEHLGIAGGVSANSQLRRAFIELGKKNEWETYIPRIEFCTDNGAMIAIAGYYKYLAGDYGSLESKPMARYGI